MDIVGGTSIGALVGGVYASTPDEQVEERTRKWFSVSFLHAFLVAGCSPVPILLITLFRCFDTGFLELGRNLVTSRRCRVCILFHLAHKIQFRY